jgi:hypothetical protein
MLRKLSLSGAALSLAVSIASAGVSFDGGKNLNIKDEIANMDVSVPQISAGKTAKPAAARGQAEWTIMVFINGKNNLAPYALKDMNEMEMVGSTDKVNIVTETGLMAGYGDMPWTGVRRFLIKKDADTNTVTSPALQDLGSVDMGSYGTVVDFGNWAKQNYPAKKYMLIIWNHGSGWERSIGIRVTKGISYDEETGSNINTPQMAQILKGIGGVDVYGSDACLMQMAEVDYEIKDYARVIVGSEETEPGDGYTYNTFLGPVVANPSMGPEDLGKAEVASYGDHYQQSGEGATQSLVETSAIPQLLNLVNNFAYTVTQAGEKDLARSARDGAQKFETPENKDLYDFARLVVAGTKSDDVKAKGQALMDFIASDLVLANRTTSAGYPGAKGISIYIPSGSLEDGYLDLQWAKYSNWDEFVNWLNK